VGPLIGPSARPEHRETFGNRQNGALEADLPDQAFLIFTGGEKAGMPTSVNREELQRLVADGAQLVEVLPPAGYAEEHLPGAINLPLKELSRSTADRLDRDRPLIVYCYDTT
jgi:hypothetical protein